MHSDLSPHLHTEECNLLIKALFQCHEEHKLSRLLGKCNSFDKAVNLCLKREVKEKKALNKNRKLRLRESKKEEES